MSSPSTSGSWPSMPPPSTARLWPRPSWPAASSGSRRPPPWPAVPASSSASPTTASRSTVPTRPWVRPSGGSAPRRGATPATSPTAPAPGCPRTTIPATRRPTGSGSACPSRCSQWSTARRWPKNGRVVASPLHGRRPCPWRPPNSRSPWATWPGWTPRHRVGRHCPATWPPTGWTWRRGSGWPAEWSTSTAPCSARIRSRARASSPRTPRPVRPSRRKGVHSSRPSISPLRRACASTTCSAPRWRISGSARR